jgi:hypothetical protein
VTLDVLRRLIATALIVLLSAMAYQAAVHPTFHAVTVPIIADVTRPAGRVARIVLPDLSSLRSSPPIISGHLQNSAAASVRVDVMLGSGTRASVNLAPGRDGRFVLRLSDGAALALANEAAVRYAIDLVGDRHEWHVISMRASNAYAGIGTLVSLVPADVAPTAASGIPWAVLVGLGALSFGLRRAFSTKTQQAHRVSAIAIAVAMAIVWWLPGMSDRRVLVSPLVFWLMAGVLFAPGLVGAARLGLDVGARIWRRHPTTCERGAMFAGLIGMAVAQPVFDVLQGSPEFLVARNTTVLVAVTATALLVCGAPAVLLFIERALRAVAPGAGTVFTFVVVATLIALMVHPWLRHGEVTDPTTMAGAAVAGGALIGWLAWRARVMRRFLAALAPVAVVVPVWFFANPDVTGSLTPSLRDVQTPPLAQAPPIVLIVFDEFPIHSLLDADGQIDTVRFPGFGRLARNASWFREATAVSSETVWAVPAIASGRYPLTPRAVPTLRYYPDNLFTLLADRYTMHVFGRFLQLCPGDTCLRDLGGPSDGVFPLLADLAVVWLHIVLPTPLTEQLPPVTGDWRGFAREARWRTVDGRQVRNDRRGEFERFLAAIDTSAERLYFLHTLLPHMPFEYVPSGRRYDAPDYQGRDENNQGLFVRVDAAYADAAHQRHLLQVGFVDTLVGQLIDRLGDLGIYDQALIIVTADHGASYREGMPRRTARTRNLADIMRVPLFIKRPGQTDGAIVDGVAESVDILPTIADVLGARLPFEVDGRTLLDGAGPERAAPTFIDRGVTRASRREQTDWRPSSGVSMARRIARFGVGTYDPLYAVPGTHALIGQSLDSYVTREGTIRVRLAAPETFRDVDLASDALPLHVRGRVFGRVRQPLAVVVNGRIAATTTPYLEQGASVFATMIPEHALRAGSNDVTTFLVDNTGGTPTLVTTLQ